MSWENKNPTQDVGENVKHKSSREPQGVLEILGFPESPKEPWITLEKALESLGEP